MIAIQATETKDSQQREVLLPKNQIKNEKILIYVPNTEIIEREDYYHLLLDMPGLEEDSIEISCESCSLTVGGQLLQINSHGNLTRKPFSHTFFLPQSLSDLGIEAQFFEGTLQISVLKDDAILQLGDLISAQIH